MSDIMNRRYFIKSGSVALASFGVMASAPSFLKRALAASVNATGRRKTLIAIFQRGAVDGLNMVVPFGEKSYYSLRPNLAIPKPDGSSDSAIDLDGFFGLHPALAPLKPIYDAVGIERINVATYQSVSGAGREAVEELAQQSIALLSGKGPVEARVVAKQIAFNCVPQIDQFQDNGYTREEMKMVWETRKILGDATLRVNATCVRVPVFYGHSEAVSVETATKITAAQARALLERAPGIAVFDERRAGGYPTAATEAANRDTVYVGRIREDLSSDRGLNLWIVADNVRKGAATNSVQIAEILVRQAI